MSKTIYALLVGINEYPAQCKLPRLNGCVADVDRMQQFLLEHYAANDPQIEVLTNEQATRENVIRTFEQHLCDTPKMQAGDVVFFYFGGHGSHQKTAPVFEALDGKEMEETMICYDSRLANHHDFSDKEIAVLLSKIKQGVETVVMVDACHSGSITRDGAEEASMEIARYAPRKDNDAPRELASYFLNEAENHYWQLQKEGKKISIPPSSHIAFSACNPKQKAWEKYGRGVFTYHLLEVLEKSNRRISYSQLFERINASVLKDVKNQTPTFKVYGNFDHRKILFSDEVKQTAHPYTVEKFKGEWCLDHGSIYGLSTDPDSVAAMQIGIYKKAAGELYDHVETVDIKEVKLKQTYLKFNHPNDNIYFQAAIINALPNTFIYLNGTEEEKAAFLEKAADSKSPFIQFTDSKAGIPYELKITENAYVINNLISGAFIHNVPRIEGYDAITQVLTDLQQIDKYDSILKLDNANTELNRSEVGFRFVREFENEPEIPYTHDNIQLDYVGKEIWFKLEAINYSNRDLFIALLYLSPRFGIKTYYSCNRVPKYNPGKSQWIALQEGEGYQLSIPDDEILSVTDHFKLIVSTESFDDYKFKEEDLTQSGAVTRDAGSRDATRPPEDDWFTKTITTHLVRPKTALDQNDTTVGPLTFKGHPAFSANVNLAPLHTNTRGISPAQQLKAFFEGEEFEIIDLGMSSRGSEYNSDASVIELSVLQDEASLSTQALEMEIEVPLAANEYLIPFTFDGEFALPIGASHLKKENVSVINIPQFPSTTDKSRQEQTRDPFRAVWFCIIKMVVPQEDIFRLKYIWKYEKGKAVYGKLPTEEIAKKVEENDNILLLIHGFIGNTQNMTKAVQPLFEDKSYPLVLTFDYENLNTEIEEIAAILDRELTKIGLGKNSPKKINVVAHSMGGLVMRYLIERIRKDDTFVDKFLLFGTPNGGSKFAEITKMRDAGRIMLSIAANTAKYLMLPITSSINLANGILGGTTSMSTTLKQMQPDSSFIKGLALNDQKQDTEYHVFAGNVAKYEASSTWFEELKDKLKIMGLQAVYGETPNDLIVSVAQITAFPDSFSVNTYEVGCYHMNYFEEEKVLRIMYEVLGK